MQNRLTVSIAGQSFSLVADEPEEYMKEIAKLANDKIVEARGLVGNTTFSTGVLATLNMADTAVKMSRKCEEYRIMSEAQQTEITRLSDELEGLRSTRPDEDPAMLHTEIRRLENELAALQKTHSAVCGEADAEMARLNDALAQCQTALDETRRQAVDPRPIEAERDRLRGENDQLRAELAQLRAAQQAEQADDSSLHAEIQQLNAALDALHVQGSEESAEAQQQISRLTEEIDALREAARAADPTPLREEIARLTEELRQREQALTRMGQLSAEVEALRREKAAHETGETVTVPRADYESLQHDLAAARTQLSGREVGEIGKLRAEMERLRAVEDAYQNMEDPEPLHAEIDRLNGELSAARVARFELEKAVRAADPAPLTAEIDTLRQQLAHTQQALEQARAAQQTAAAPDITAPAAAVDPEALETLTAEVKRLKAELNRQLQINQSLGQRHKVDQSLVQRRKKKGGK